jgi:hypothetical protein
MSLQQLAAQRMAAQGRGPDTQLVHMSPREVAGLQALAMAQGGSLTINPETGLPEAGFLDSMLPMILGIGAMALTGGAAGAAMPGLFGMGMPATIGLGVGALQTARTGSLEKGLMAGLGAYGGAGLAGGLMAAGAGAGAGAAGAAGTDAVSALGGGAGAPAMPGITGAASAVPTAPPLEMFSQGAGAPAMPEFFSQSPALNAGSHVEALGTPRMPFSTPVTPTIPPAAAQPSFGEGFKQLGRGFSAITEPGGFDAFMGKAASKGVEATGVGGGMGLLKYGAAAAAPLLVSDTKTKMPAEDKERYNYRFDAGRTEEGYVDPVTGTRQYFRPTYTRYAAAGGPVEDMSMSNVYDMQNARGGVSDMGIDNSTGMQRMAGGGISDLGDYSDGGRLLRGPGDGVSDSIPAMIGAKQPARLADGEFVVPARIVSELGNGSTDAGARKLYAMMDRVQKARGKTTGKNRVAANTRSEKYLPA